ncbi:MAG TPA: hypothetical protein VFZ80_00155 [Acidimicrobiia bacterium]
MTRYYHDRFFADTRYTAFAVLTLSLIGFWGVAEAFLLIPVVALLGANQTAFDASYLFMADVTPPPSKEKSTGRCVVGC